MEVKPKNIGRLASLSALGAGAIVATAGTAEAGIIYSGAINQTVGVSPGSQANYDITLPGTAVIRLGEISFPIGPSGTNLNGVILGQYSGSVNFLTCGCGSIRAFAGGANWNSLFPINGVGGVAYRISLPTPGPTSGSSSPGTSGGPGSSSGSSSPSSTSYPLFYTNFTATDRYALFQFNDTVAGGWRYGWIQLLVNLSQTTGPDVTLVDWAYEDTGAVIAAGDTPEPSTFVLTGLAALALGAKGTRRWRKSRKKAA